MARETHYRTKVVAQLGVTKTICGRVIGAQTLTTTEYGEVSCRNCIRRYFAAGYQALGFKPKEAKAMAAEYARRG